MVYCVAGLRFWAGAKVNTVPLADRIKGGFVCRRTVAPGAAGVPWNSTRLAGTMLFGSIGTGDVIVMMVPTGTPRLLSAGDAVAVLTTPLSTISTVATWPAVSGVEAVPVSEVVVPLAVRFTV